MFMKTHLSFTDVEIDCHERIMDDFNDRIQKKIIILKYEKVSSMIVSLMESYESESRNF